ncbi:MAG: hypothetical protein ACKVOM_06985 [Ferruginibacter sp.]
MTLKKYPGVFFTLIFIVNFGFKSTAQIVMKEGVLQYDRSNIFFYKQKNPNTNFISTRTISFKPNELWINEHTIKNLQVLVQNKCTDTIATTYLTDNRTFYKVQNASLNNFFELDHFTKSSLTYQYLDDTATITGINCKKAMAIITNIKNNVDTLFIWYATNYNLAPTCFNNYFKNLKGLPVQFYFNSYKSHGKGSKQIEFVRINYNLQKMEFAFKEMMINKEKYILLSKEEKFDKINQAFLYNNNGSLEPF